MNRSRETREREKGRERCALGEPLYATRRKGNFDPVPFLVEVFSQVIMRDLLKRLNPWKLTRSLKYPPP